MPKNLKQAELQKICKCISCEKGVMHTGLPLFYTVTVNRYGIDVHAVRRQAGLEMMLGNPGMAAVMGTDEDMAKPMMDEVTLTFCENCMQEKCMEILIGIESKGAFKPSEAKES